MGVPLRVGPPLASEPIAFRAIDDDEWEVVYGPLLIGYALHREGKVWVEPAA